MATTYDSAGRETYRAVASLTISDSSRLERPISPSFCNTLVLQETMFTQKQQENRLSAFTYPRLASTSMQDGLTTLSWSGPITSDVGTYLATIQS